MTRFLILFAVVARLLPHPMNFTPIGAFGLFAGARMPLLQALALPVVALLVGNIITGFYDARVLVAVYIGFLAGPLIGRAMLRARRGVVPVASAVLVNAIAFYLISNIGNWIAFYPPTFPDLMACYVAGLPMLMASIAGDAVYATLLFGGEAAIAHMREARRNEGGHAA